MVINKVYDKGFRFQEEEFEIAHEISPRLMKLWVRAKDREYRSAMEVEPGENPAMIEGEIFASLYEGFNDFEILKVERENEDCIATVRFGFSFEGSDEVETWEEQLVLTKYKGDWKLHNVIYAEGRNYPTDLHTYLKNFSEEI